MSGTLQHTHQYRRVSAKNRKQYMCIHPQCYHKIGKHLLLGKLSFCNKCSKEFILDTYALTLAKPICADCRGSRQQEKRVKKLTSEHLKERLGELGKLL